MNPSPAPDPRGSTDPLLARLERRLARIEKHLGLESLAEEGSAPEASNVAAPVPKVATTTDDELEFHVGQNWFAKLGIVVLAIGIAFSLSLPFPDLPAVAPSLFGYVLAAGLFLLSYVGRQSFEMVSRYFRWAGMALLYFATLRLFFFGAEPVMSTTSVAGRALLLAVVAANLFVGFRRQSPYLVMMGFVFGLVTALAVGTPWFVLLVVAVLAAVLVFARLKHDWPVLLLLGVPLIYSTYVIWAINNPFMGNELHLVKEPVAAIWFLPLYAVILAIGSLLRPDRSFEDPVAIVSTALSCGGCYGAFLLHTLAATSTVFAVSHTGMALVLIGLAIAFWIRERSRGATFLYAMSGYMALSAAIIKAVPAPDVFVWLSLQSVLVATTAIWFRSRFIVVANFMIFVGIVTAYVALAPSETGISVGFGLVALVTARILNWKKDRMELKTDLMRNAYLVCAFVIFPYALSHLVPDAFVALSWVGIAVVYYVLNLIIRNRKYRWMAHGTLLLAVLHVIVVGITKLEPIYRNISFLALGSVLLAVSLVFTKVRAREPHDNAS